MGISEQRHHPADTQEFVAMWTAAKEEHFVQELAPLLPAASGADSSGSVDVDPRGGSRIAEETADSGSWHSADHVAGDTSGNTDVAEVEDAQEAGDIVSTACSTRLSSSGTEEEDLPPGRQP